MTVEVDDREGSRELADLIPDSTLTRLEYGDAAFWGNGAEGPVRIGIERKRIRDLVNSIATGRLSGHQLPGLLDTYDVTYLIVEGEWGGNRQGELEVMGRSGWRTLEQGRRFSQEGIWHYLTTLEATGVRIRTTTYDKETAQIIQFLHSWWQKEWKSHKGHKAMHRAPPPRASLSLDKPTRMEKVLSELPGVGWQRSKEAAKRFETVEDMITAGEEEWAEVAGIGKTGARRIYRFLHMGME